MEEMQNQDAPKMSSIEEVEELELTHTDKLVGIFSEPSKTFEKIAKYPAKATDWFIPLALFVVTMILATVIQLSNPEIKLQAKEKSIAEIQKSIDSGEMTQEQGDQTIEMTEKMMDGPFMLIGTSIGIIFFVFIAFFVVSGVFYLFVKMILKGDGTYKDALVANGLPVYIGIIQWIVILILSLVMGKQFKSTGVAEFLSLDKSSIIYFVLSKLDLFSIWSYLIIAIAFAKMFKSMDTKKYIILVFGMWIGFSLIVFLLSKVFPFMQSFNG